MGGCVMRNERRSAWMEVPRGGAGGRSWWLLWMVGIVGLVAVSPARGQERFRGPLATEVIGADETTPGGIVMFRIDVRGATPGATVTVYEQLGSNLSYVGD